MGKSIVIYHDEGVGEFGLSCLRRFFKKDTIKLVSTSEVVKGSAFEGADIFVMPGGADLPYCKKLNGAGNSNIRSFVENGGTYLGICAGAYYACRDIEYHKGRVDEICGPRELALIDATAIGSLPELAPYYDEKLQTVAAANLKSAIELTAYYHGGCKFSLHENVTTLARYDFAENDAAVIEKIFGRGRVLLSGVHLEVSANDVKDYPLEEGDNPAHLSMIGNNLKNPHEFLRSILREL